MTHTQEEHKTLKTAFEGAQMLDLPKIIKKILYLLFFLLIFFK